jgi:hypothetical protein
MRHQIKKYPLLVVFITILAAFGLYPWLNDFGIITTTKKFIIPIFNGLLHINFDPWFINNYVNPDGNQMGWPGLNSIFYYGYNIGLALPVLFIWAIIKKKINKKTISENWIYVIAFLLFFIIAEVLPRLGIYYYPDRSWLFVSLCSILFLITVYSKTEERKSLNIIIFLSSLITLFATFSLIYLKQGWINKYEIEAAIFLRENTPTNTVVITQRGNSPLVEYYANRYFISGTNIFDNSSLENNLKFYDNIEEYLSKKQSRLQLKKNVENNLYNSIAGLSKSFPNYLNVYRKQIVNQLGIYEKNSQRYKLMKSQKLDQEKKVYILYSHQKFNSLYGTRTWWKKYNFYNADLAKFDNINYYEKIYDKNGVIIWKIKTK